MKTIHTPEDSLPGASVERDAEIVGGPGAQMGPELAQAKHRETKEEVANALQEIYDTLPLYYDPDFRSEASDDHGVRAAKRLRHIEKTINDLTEILKERQDDRARPPWARLVRQIFPKINPHSGRFDSFDAASVMKYPDEKIEKLINIYQENREKLRASMESLKGLEKQNEAEKV